MAIDKQTELVLETEMVSTIETARTATAEGGVVVPEVTMDGYPEYWIG